MKTTLPLLPESFSAAERRFIRIAAIMLIGLLFSAAAFAQLPRLGLGITSSASANGFGTLYTPSLQGAFRNYGISCGPAIQKQTGKVAGIRFGAERFLCTSTGGRLRLTAFYNGGVYHQAQLGRSCLVLERAANPEMADQLDKVMLRGCDHHAGISVDMRIYKALSISGSVGAGFYDSHITSAAVDHLYHSSTDVSFEMKCGLLFTLIKGN